MRNAILVVDDDQDIREAVAAALAAAGHETIAAANGESALAILRERRGAIDLIILDLMMPVMDGWGFRERQLRDPSLREIPILILSAGGQVEKKAQNLGAGSWLRKPVSLEVLLLSVSSALKRRPAE